MLVSLRGALTMLLAAAKVAAGWISLGACITIGSKIAHQIGNRFDKISANREQRRAAKDAAKIAATQVATSGLETIPVPA